MRKSFSLLVLVAVVSAALGGVAVAAHDFTDVPDSHPFHDDISWLASTGVTDGFPDGTYRPGQPVTRQSMAAFLRRIAGFDPEVGRVVDAKTLQGRNAADFDNAVTLNGRVPADYDNAATLNGQTNEQLQPNVYTVPAVGQSMEFSVLPVVTIPAVPAGTYLVTLSGRLTTTYETTSVSCFVQGNTKVGGLGLGTVPERTREMTMAWVGVIDLPAAADLVLSCRKNTSTPGSGVTLLHDAELTAVAVEDL